MKLDSRAISLIRRGAYNLYLSSLGGSENQRKLFEELNEPKQFDLVVERSTIWSNMHQEQSVGNLMRTEREPICSKEEWIKAGAEEDEPVPTQLVHVIRLCFDDNREFRWTNASFIKVKTDIITS